MVDLNVLANKLASLFFKDAEFIQEHGQSIVVLELHHDLANVHDFVLDVHDHLIVRCPLEPSLLFGLISKQRDAGITIGFDLLVILLLFFFVHEVELAVQDLNKRFGHLDELLI